jgi:hypothetical protein
MTVTTGYYSIVQYCPDPMRREVANIGVVLFCPQLEFLEVRIADDDSRIREVSPRLVYDPEQLGTELRFIERRLRVDREHFTKLAALQQFAQTRLGAVRLTEWLSLRVVEPDGELQRLFMRLVYKRKDDEARAKILDQLTAEGQELGKGY